MALIAALLVGESARASEMKLSWDRCAADGIVPTKAFLCDTNQGFETLVGSFVLDAPMERFAGVQCQIMVQTTGPQVPSWWTFKNVYTCRVQALTANVLPLGPESQCFDPFQGHGQGGFASYEFSYGGPSQARIIVAHGLAAAFQPSLAAGQEVFAFRLRMDRTLTVGAGACVGCDERICITFIRADVLAPGNPDAFRLPLPDTGFSAATVTWQGAQGAAYERHCEPHSSDCHLVASCSAATPARMPTWGAMKSLYR